MLGNREAIANMLGNKKIFGGFIIVCIVTVIVGGWHCNLSNEEPIMTNQPTKCETSAHNQRLVARVICGHKDHRMIRDDTWIYCLCPDQPGYDDPRN